MDHIKASYQKRRLQFVTGLDKPNAGIGYV